MSDDLSWWLSAVHSVLCPFHDDHAAAASSDYNPNPDLNNAANRKSDHPSNHDESSIMAQILQCQQHITYHLVDLNKTPASVWFQHIEVIIKKDSVSKPKHWNYLSANKCQMALSATLTDGKLITTTLPAQGVEFFLVSTTAAKSVLENYVHSMFPRFMVSYLLLLIHHLRNSMIDCPEGVTIFFTPSSMPDIGATWSALVVDLEASQGAAFSVEMVQAQIKMMKPSVPLRFLDLLPQVQRLLCDFCCDFWH